jgi:ribosomal protein S18 acetylase RimI-like enzyme
MKQGVEIRPVRIDDLRGVFILGKELFGTAGPVTTSWSELNLAEIIADNFEISFVAVYKKIIAGFIIGTIENDGINDGTASILWLCVRRFEQYDIAGDLLHAFHQCLIEKNVYTIKTEVATSQAELIEFYRKFGFTETEHVLIMENFLSKNKRSGTQKAKD